MIVGQSFVNNFSCLDLTQHHIHTHLFLDQLKVESRDFPDLGAWFVVGELVFLPELPADDDMSRLSGLSNKLWKKQTRIYIQSLHTQLLEPTWFSDMVNCRITEELLI